MSKKLENNGLWESSRMMLPQHREAIQNRHHVKPIQQTAPKREEIELMRDSILLPMLQTIVVRKIQDIERSSETLRLLYSKVAQILASRIYADVSRIQGELMEQDIEVFIEEKDDQIIRCRYTYRGYEDGFMMTREAMRAEISVKLGRYIDQFVKSIRAIGS